MRLFVSWSGEPSRKVAELLRDWVPNVIQEAELFVSLQDIAKGERWSSSLSQALEQIDLGLIAVTQDNLNAPWVQFEAGALSKSVKSRVIPVLCDLDRLDAGTNPLAQFQYASKVNNTEFKLVITEINASCERPLPDARLQRSFEKWWPDFQEKFEAIEFGAQQKPEGKGTKANEGQRLARIERAVETLMDNVASLRRDFRAPYSADLETGIDLRPVPPSYRYMLRPPRGDKQPDPALTQKLLKALDDSIGKLKNAEQTLTGNPGSEEKD